MTTPKHEIRQRNPGILLTRDDLAARWDVSLMTLVRHEAKGILTPLRLPGAKRGFVRYRLADIERIEHEALVRSRPLASKPSRQRLRIEAKAVNQPEVV
jgi:hypothetical protein